MEPTAGEIPELGTYFSVGVDCGHDYKVRAASFSSVLHYKVDE